MAFFKTLVVVALPILLAFSTASSQTLEAKSDPMRERYEQWIATNKRTYKDNKEKEQRFFTFKKNVEYVEGFNGAKNHTYELGINQFMDLTNKEFLALYTGYKSPPSLATKSYGSFIYENVTQMPSSIDWRLNRAVTPVKDQGPCGSCWAFSAVAAVESLIKLDTNNLISLSEQELLDCDTKGEDEGCKGGLMDSAFKFIMSEGGLATETTYPYKANVHPCNKKALSKLVAKINGYENVPAKNEQALQKAVANQPVSVAIDVSGDFQFYFKGVFSGDCGTSLNHAMAVVGYGSAQNGIKYWLVKNSWGVGWGEEGYIRMKKDVEEKEGLCGIAMLASYPTGRKSNLVN